MSNQPSLEKDLEAADNAADKTLLRFLEVAKADDTKSKHPTRSNGSAANGTASNDETDKMTTTAGGRRTRRRQRGHATTSTKSAPARSASWSQPSAVLNTRIPPEMANLLDDLVYRLKREKRQTGISVSKQSLVTEAIDDLLRKYRLVA
jgi:hypothetical protein